MLETTTLEVLLVEDEVLLLLELEEEMLVEIEGTVVLDEAVLSRIAEVELLEVTEARLDLRQGSNMCQHNVRDLLDFRNTHEVET